MPRPPRPCLIWISSGARSTVLEKSDGGEDDDDGVEKGAAGEEGPTPWLAPSVPPFLKKV